MVTLLHVSPRVNLPSIWKHGIDPAFASAPVAACWFVAGSLRAWAISHVAARYDLPESEVVVLRVRVPRKLLIRRARGKWTCATVVRSIVSVAITNAAA